MNWIVLKALNDLYLKGTVDKNETLNKSDEIAFLVDSLQVLHARTKKYQKVDGFNEIYADKYLRDFNSYRSFLQDSLLLFLIWYE